MLEGISLDLEEPCTVERHGRVDSYRDFAQVVAYLNRRRTEGDAHLYSFARPGANEQQIAVEVREAVHAEFFSRQILGQQELWILAKPERKVGSIVGAKRALSALAV